MVKCHLCNREFIDNRSLINHVRLSHKDLTEEDFYKYTNRDEKSTCSNCCQEKYTFQLKEGLCEDCYRETHIICPICNKPVRMRLKQHINKAHKGLSKDDYYKFLGRTKKSFCKICGKEDYLDELKHDVCKDCFTKYSISCTECGQNLLWRVAYHYTKAHPNTNLPQDLGELKIIRCKDCNKILEISRIPYGIREREIFVTCDDCNNKLIECPFCHQKIVSSKNFYGHLLHCFKLENSELNNFIYNLKDEMLKQRILEDYNSFTRSSSYKSFEEAFGFKEVKEKLPTGGWRYNFTKTPKELAEIRSLQLQHKREKYDGYCCSKEKRVEISERMKKNNPMFREDIKQKRNSTCMEIYGVDNVMKVPEIRLKSHTHGDRCNNFSKISVKFFQELDILLNLSNSFYGKNEWFIKLDKGNVLNQDIIFVDYYNHSLDLVIEFYGDYWHGNPKLYKPEDIIRDKRACDIWEHDRLKKEIILSYLNPRYFYEVWESDFNLMLEVIKNDVINEKSLG